MSLTDYCMGTGASLSSTETTIDTIWLQKQRWLDPVKIQLETIVIFEALKYLNVFASDFMFHSSLA